MKNSDVQNVLKKIRKVVYHVGTFENSYPRIFKSASLYTRAHLIVVYEVLPYLKHILTFAAETVPVIGQMLGVASRGSADLKRASQNLKKINGSAETAVKEIFEVLDRVNALLQKAQQQGTEEETRAILREAHTQVMSIMNALQFQDIIAQQIEATNALLARLGQGMKSLVEQLGVAVEDPAIEVRLGTFDEHAAFDREASRIGQEAADAVVETGGEEEAVPEAEAPSKPEEPETEAVAEEESGPPASEGKEEAAGGAVGQDDIDALIADQEPADGEEEETLGQDDIEALLAEAQGEPKHS